LPTDKVSFGELAYLGSNDTTDNLPPPFVIQNDGNSLIDINISAGDLWQEASNPSEYFRLKADNVTGEGGSFDWGASSVTWTNMPAVNNSIMISSLNHSASLDSVEIDIYVEGPPNEPPNTRNTTVTFIALFGE